MIKIILLDDEENAVDIMEVILQETRKAEVVGKFTRPVLFLAELERLHHQDRLPHAVLIDIEMPEMGGMEVAEIVKERYPQVEVVFVTAYSEYAIQAFEMHSLDYLLKPTSRKRVEKTLARLQLPAVPPAAPTMYIQSLGKFAIFYNQGSQRLKWRTGKVKELCALLLHSHQRPIAAPIFIESLFPDTHYNKAKILFYTSMSYLRKSLKEIGYPNAIQKHEDGYLIHIEGMEWDYLQVREKLRDSQLNERNHWSLVQQLMKLYQGDYFENIEQRAFVGSRQELRQQVLEVLQLALERSEQEGKQARMLDCLLHMLRIAPESEELTLRLIKHYAEHGRRAEALQCYKQFKQHIEEEYGIAPGEEISSFVTSIAGES